MIVFVCTIFKGCLVFYSRISLIFFCALYYKAHIFMTSPMPCSAVIYLHCFCNTLLIPAARRRLLLEIFVLLCVCFLFLLSCVFIYLFVCFG
ncbi:hypothetical protein FKM82_015031 [Ascaphus truei]